MLKNHIGKLIKYDKHFWLLDKIENGEAELWFNGNCITVPLDDLDESNVIEVDKDK